MRRFYSTDPPVSALAQRIASILESKINDSTASQLSNDPTLSEQLKVLKELDLAKAKEYNQKHQVALKRTDLSNERLLASNKHARETANAKPWTGTESLHDANLRMLVDSKPPPLKVSTGKRILSARESSLDYKLGIGIGTGKDSENKPESESEAGSFKEMYKERLLGPSMLVNSNPQSAFGMIGSIADARIAELINKTTGRFDSDHNMSQVRGKPLSKEYLQNCTDLNFFMNKIMQNQEVLPPWVENKKLLVAEINRFRQDLDNSSLDLSLVAFFKLKVDKLNQQIRNYNLLAPSASLHMFKLLWETELSSRNQRLHNKPKILESSIPSSSSNHISSTESGTPEKESIWSSFRGIFK
ncbi:uncharacterized protein KQ657_000105 [Scheffersomyces spartinae]|uniref:DnaJ homologue subfamily C member 28 conserved domain-containing protein n=1 Tax=Scheffersomyces spartinae TaxID=45513 RepID=A0A9P7VDE7_9ASCO|nr:uncharacterized protein KQ657_000105 [Scheffersomyces spartinae]KAG7196093.1 hypothetical protein KQ657_000105 [Scheffersomyces spartinae]